jgi:NodT family efflux transporter outer membrane factor (OMF) lipoprotein
VVANVACRSSCNAARSSSAATAFATTYYQLRGQDAIIALLQQTIDAYQHALNLTIVRHTGGLATAMDVARARTQLASAQAQLQDTLGQRALLEDALAVLTGVPPEQLSVASATQGVYLPQVPTGMPSTLLQRRPDIAAAERRVFAANATIGVAKAAYFPNIGLGLDGGYDSDTFSPWLAAPNEIWSVGPSLMFTLFDGGRRSAQVTIARRLEDQAAAQYRSVVINAVREVDDNLALQRTLSAEAQRVDEENAAAAQTLDIAMARYRDGTDDYLDVVTAQQDALEAQTQVRTVETRRIAATVGLIQALGGGWSEPGSESMASR